MQDFKKTSIPQSTNTSGRGRPIPTFPKAIQNQSLRYPTFTEQI